MATKSQEEETEPNIIGSIKISIRGIGFEEVKGKNELHFSSEKFAKAKDTILQGLRNLHPIFLLAEEAKGKKIKEIVKLRPCFDYEPVPGNKIEVEFKVETEAHLTLDVFKAQTKKVFRDAFVQIVGLNTDKEMYFYVEHPSIGYKFLHSCSIIPTEEEVKELQEYEKQQTKKEVLTN